MLIRDSKTYWILTFTICALLTTAVEGQSIIYVDANATGANNGSSWADAYNSLQRALVVARGGDEIWVAEGVYKPDQENGITPGDREATFQLINGVALYGGFPSRVDPNWEDRDPSAYETILSGDLNGNDGPDFANNDENSYHVVTASDTDETAIIDGFIITAGNASGDFADQYGGGMYNKSGSLTLVNCTFSGNSANSYGGGVYFKGSFGGSLKLIKCTFSGNSAGTGGGVASYGAHNGTLTDCTFSGNSAIAGGGIRNQYSYRNNMVLTNCIFSQNSAQNGGAMYNDYSSPKLTNCSFTGNSADDEGGGVFILSSDPLLTNCTFVQNSADKGGGMKNRASSVILTSCTFRGNSAIQNGGAIEFWTSSSSILRSPTLINCTLSGNSAGQNGGGFYSDGGRPTLANCTLSGNSAGQNGGGFYNYEAGPWLTNCTLSGNSAGQHGGAFYHNRDYFGSTANLTNCILWGNSAMGSTDETSQIYIYSGEPIVNYCCIQGLTGILGGEGNISDDPLFVDSDGLDNITGTEDDNLRLSGISPCLNSGNNDALPDDITDLDDDGITAEPIPFDLDGKPRIIDVIVDMGTYEEGNQAFVITGEPVTVPEGGVATFTVALSMDPFGIVEVTVARYDGDEDVSVQSGGTLLFDSNNFDMPQIVTLAAAEDLDLLNGTAIIRISSVGLPDVFVIAAEAENDLPRDLLFVDASATGFNYGISWTDAFTDLQDAINIAKIRRNGIKEIWVAGGTYRPSLRTDPYGSRSATFKLVNGVAIYGGFPPGGGEWEDRNAKVYETVLSGDLCGNDVGGPDHPSRRDNIYHVLTCKGTDQTTLLDGFTITGGNANVYDWDLNYHYGGGMYIGGGWYGVRLLTISNCVFTRNSATYGGGMYIYKTRSPYMSPRLINCMFTENRAQSGGAVANEDSGTRFINCTFIGNSAKYDLDYYSVEGEGGAICNWNFLNPPPPYVGYTYDPALVNCIFWGNTAARGPELYISGSSNPIVSHCNISGGQEVVSMVGGATLNWGEGNIDVDPLLTPDGHLRASSPCIDAGDSDAVPPDVGDLDGDGNTAEPIPFDIDGDSRFVDDPYTLDTDSGPVPIVDMGADEFLDTDGDGLPDFWEQKYFGDPNIADPNDDPDGDRITNLNEYELYSSNPVAPPYWVNDRHGNDAYDGMSHNPKGNSVGPKKTIQAAIDAADDGDTILVTPGRYIGPGNRDIDFGGKSIVLRSLSGSAPSTTIDCEGLGRGFYFHSGETPATAVVGFTITNGWAPHSGAIVCDQSSPQIRDCVLTGNSSPPVARRCSLLPPYSGWGRPKGYDFSEEMLVDCAQADLCWSGYGFVAQHGISHAGRVFPPATIPDTGYTQSVGASVGHCYVVLPGEVEEGYCILLEVVDIYLGPRGYVVTFDWIYVDRSAWPDSGYEGGAIYCKLSTPTLSNCAIIDNNPYGVWMEYGGARIEGIVELASNDWVGNDLMLYGDGTIQIDSTVTLDLTDARIRCDISGPGTIQVNLDSELIIESDAVISLYNEADPNANGQILCDGLLRLREDATVMDAQVYVSRASFEDNAIILNSVITAEAGAPYGQFFIEDSVEIWLDSIWADGDRYLDLDPTEFDVNNIHIDIIDVNITEGVGGTYGGLLELRGKPDLVTSIWCDPNNEFFCQVVDPETVPPFDPDNWTINRLELVEDAKLNLTNRFDFQYPYDSGGDDEALYVKELILRANSVFNTAFNQVYYETLIAEPTARIINVPLLGFSLNNISFDDENDYLTRIKHNNFKHPTDSSYDRDHLERIVGEAPDPAGLMRMCNLEDEDPLSPTYGDIFSARAKGLFAKSSEDEILIQFEYLFCSSDPDVELVIYLTDVPELLSHSDPERDDHYIEVARLNPPRPGRPGSAGSGRLGLFKKTVSVGHLDFIRGTRIEFELLGPHNTCILINNWDPWVDCDDQTYCMDIDGENGVTVLDFLSLIGEYGRSTSEIHSGSGTSLSCLDGIFTEDGYVSMSDFLGWDWLAYLQDRALVGNFCFNVPLGSGGFGMSSSVGAAMLKTAQAVSYLTAESSGFEGELLVAGKLHDPNLDDSWVFLGDRLYGFDEDYNLVSGPFARDDDRDRFNGRVIRSHEGEFYQLNIEEGLIPLFVPDQNSVLPPDSFFIGQELRYKGSATIHVGLQGEPDNWWGRPILDAAFDPSGYVYVTPVVVEPDANEPYLASAKLQLRPEETPPYSIVQLYDDPCFFDPAHPENPNLNGLCEIEVDTTGNLYVLNAHRYNESDTLWKYDTESGTMIERLVLGNPTSSSYIPAPIGMHVSGATGMLYVASSRNQPQANFVLLYVLSKDDLDSVKTIRVNGMGHITDITEDPTTGTIWVSGFKMETIPDFAELSAPPFYEPYIAKIPYGSNGPVDATCLSGVTDLALPVSIVWTGDKCSGTNLSGGDDTVDFADFAFLAEHWLESNCLSPDWCDGADLDKSTVVSMKDLAILASYWLETGCN